MDPLHPRIGRETNRFPRDTSINRMTSRCSTHPSSLPIFPPSSRPSPPPPPSAQPSPLPIPTPAHPPLTRAGCLVHKPCRTPSGPGRWRRSRKSSFLSRDANRSASRLSYVKQKRRSNRNGRTRKRVQFFDGEGKNNRVGGLEDKVLSGVCVTIRGLIGQHFMDAAIPCRQKYHQLPLTFVAALVRVNNLSFRVALRT